MCSDKGVCIPNDKDGTIRCNCDDGYSGKLCRKYNIKKTVAWLAHVVERRNDVREVEGSSIRPDQQSGS